MQDVVYAVDLPYKKNEGLTDLDLLEDLHVSRKKEKNEKIKHILRYEIIRDFNKKADSLEVNKLFCLSIPAGMIGILVATFFIREPYRYMAICFGLFLIPIFPIYVCIKKKKKDNAIKKFEESVREKTYKKLEANRLIDRFKTNSLGKKNHSHFVGFRVSVRGFTSERRITLQNRKSNIRQISYIVNLNAEPDPQNKAESKSTAENSLTNHRQTPSTQRRSSLSKEAVIKSTSIQPPPKRQATRPPSLHSIHDEFNFPSNSNPDQTNLPVPTLIVVDTDSENEKSTKSKKMINNSDKGLQKDKMKKKDGINGDAEFKEDPTETWVDYSAKHQQKK